ncbi:MAG: site-2 protease family protein [Solirubrobacteraceae bacterium]
MNLTPRGSIQLARLFGIRIGVSASWFVVLFFFIYVLSGYFRDVLGSDAQGYSVAVASALLFFTSLVLHELGHALAARREGIETAGIDLWFFGGIAKLSGDSPTAGAEFRIAIAGPLVTLLIIAVCVAVGALAGGGLRHFADVAELRSGVHASAGLVLLSWLATINLFLLAFNLVPAYPLDGGRVARAVAWWRTGDRNRATIASARLGQAFAYLLGGLGFAMLLGVLSGGTASGLWLLILSMFLGQAARGAVLQSTLSSKISDVRIADIMDRDPVAIPGTMSLLDAREEFFARYRWPWFAVAAEDGRYLGVLRLEAVERELSDGHPALTAADAAEAEAPWQLDAAATLDSLLTTEGLRRLGAVIAVDAEGRLAGVVTLAQVRRALTPV